MKYTIQRLDKRYSYSDLFQYYIGFTKSMMNNRGPEHFNDTLRWFTKTYGWSAEINQYSGMLKYYTISNGMVSLMHTKFRNHPLLQQPSTPQKPFPECCKNVWSWSNTFDDLRIYVATDRELTFFQLAFPIDQ